MRTAENFNADMKALGLPPLSVNAMEIALHMGDSMRLVVPVGDTGMLLIGDPRLHDARRKKVIDKPGVIELINKRVISELPEYSTYTETTGEKVGWREMFKGHEAVIPEGAKVFALAQ